MPLTKSLFREKCLKKIKNSPQHNKRYKSYLLEKRLLQVLKKVHFKSILFYYPRASEIDIRKILIHLRKKKQVYIPFMEGESFKMVPFRLPLKRKKFGIFEAGNTNKKINKIDIAIVPTIGVDGSLQRIGFGKGMYDRFFAKSQKKPYTIFIQEEFCYTKEQICDEYDISCDLLLSPRTIIKRTRIRRGQ
jgi:5-formyltetrahydrofolate cyclo-ligase